MAENMGIFNDARWALFWSADVLRRRYLPKIGAFWRESGAEMAASDSNEGVRDLAALEGGSGRVARREGRVVLPTDDDERHALALKVEDVLRGMGAPGLLLRQMAWGDAWSENALRVAMAHREKGRREGLRIRVSYRYSYRQLASLQDCDAKTVWRRVRAALRDFSAALERAGLLWQPENERHVLPKAGVKALKAREFRKAG